MVDGCTPLKRPDPCVVVDLDGTLIEGNSFRILMRCMLEDTLRSRDIIRLMRMLWWISLRACRLVSHVGMKYPFHRMATHMPEEKLDEFASFLVGLIRPEVRRRLSALQSEGYRIIIATAAPDCYLKALARRVGADGYVATPITDNRADYVETRGEEKLVRALALARTMGCEIRSVFTDHPDDLPLLRLPGIDRVLVAAAPGLGDTLGQEGLDYTSEC